MHNISILLALMVPLTLDTFVLSGALSMAGLDKKHHLRTSFIFALFEAIMPAIGVLIGVGLGEWLGKFAGYTAAIVIGLAGLILLKPGSDESKEIQRMKLLAHAKGLAVIDLGLSISIDELAIGLSLGLLGVSLWLVSVLIGLQAFLASQLGFYLGRRLSEKMRERAEMLGGLFLVGLAAVLVVLKLTGNQL